MISRKELLKYILGATAGIALPCESQTGTGSGNGQKPPAVGKAKVIDVSGIAQKAESGASKFLDINIGDLLNEKTTVKTGLGAAVLLQLPNRYLVRIGEKSQVELNKLGQSNEFSLNVVSGKIWNLVRGAVKPSKYEVQTPSAVVGVSGTVFSVFAEEEDQSTIVSTAEGLVNVIQNGQTLNVAQDQFTHIGKSVQNPMVASMSNAPVLRQMWRTIRTNEFARAGSISKLNHRFESSFNPSWKVARTKLFNKKNSIPVRPRRRLPG